METTATNPGVRVRSLRRVLLRIGTVAFMLLVVVAWFVMLRPTSLGGPTTYVIVSGSSMQPTLHSGDLVIAFEHESYSVGDVVVYRVPGAEAGAGTNIVHRIVGGNPRTGFLVKGDSREGPDNWKPTAKEILGEMEVSVPSAGSGLVFLRTPAGMALLAGLTTLLIALGVSQRPGAEARGHRLRAEDDR